MEMLGAMLGRPATSYFDLEARTCSVTVYSERKPAAGLRKTVTAGLVEIETCGLNAGPRKLTIAKVRREDWAESWKRHFKPIEIGSALLIKPSWSKLKPRRNQAVVVLDPGLSFGTGQHPTTAFCLSELVRSAGGPPADLSPNSRAGRPRSAFLDIGTGSGILAIAAAKLGYQPVQALDFDAKAVKIARVNARMNGVERRIGLWCGDAAKLPLRPIQKFDLVCANLISNLLIAERRRIAAQLRPAGTLVLAGILKQEFREVQTAFEKLGLKLMHNRADREWKSGAFRRC